MRQLLAECLPFARRGILTMVEPMAVSVRQAGEDAGLAAALGRAGFLVLVVAQDSWPLASRVSGDRLVRIAPGAFLWARHSNADFLTGSIEPDDPVHGPVLVMGRTFGPGTPVDARAVRASGGRVYAVGRRDQPWVNDAAGSSSSGEGAFLAWAACDPFVEAAVLRFQPAAEAIRSAAACSPGVVTVSPAVVGWPRLPRDDAEAAQLAALLAADALAVAERDAAASLAAGALAAADASSGTSGAAVVGTLARSEDVRRPQHGPRRSWISMPDPGVPVPVHRDPCLPWHTLRAVGFLTRCLPGRRGLYVMSQTMPWHSMLFQRPQHVARAMAEGQRMLVLYLSRWRSRRLIEMAPDVAGVFLGDGLEVTQVQGAVISVYSTMPWCAERCAADAEAAGNTAMFEHIDAVDAAVSGIDHVATLRRGLQRSGSCASVVVYTAAKLREDLPPPREGAEQVFAPNGVFLPQYDVPADAPVPSAIQDLVASGRPIVGYFGAIAAWIWTELIHEAAALVPEAEFLMIGPAYSGSRIPQAHSLPPNVRYLGAVPSSDLVLYARHWSVGIIPFRRGDVARTTSPLKLFEYFALGLPVVVTDDLLECRRFPQVRSARDAGAFAVEVRAAIRDSVRPETAATMRKLAEANSWERRAETMLSAATRTIRRRRAT